MQTHVNSNNTRNSGNVHRFPTPQQDTKVLIEQSGFTIEAVIDKDVMTAKAFPRDVHKCVKNIELTISMSPEVAASCYYSITMGKKTITGASIRLAEICSSFWGNIQSGTRVISNNGKSIVVEGWCLDLETNTRVSHEVSRGILTREGTSYTTDMQNMTIAAASAIAFRNAIFKTIPRVFLDQALQTAMNMAVMTSGQEEFENKRQNMFEYLERIGVRLANIFAFFGKSSIQEFGVEDMRVIYGVKTSIKEGMIKAEEAFALPETRADRISSMIEMEDDRDLDCGNALVS